jgi:histidinol dehydrogenase
MRILSGTAAERRVAQLADRSCEFAAIEPKARRIVEKVRRDGDRAVRAYAEKWDGVKRGVPFRVSEHDLEKAAGKITAQFRNALKQAATNIRRFCVWQRPRAWTRQTSGIAL